LGLCYTKQKHDRGSRGGESKRASRAPLNFFVLVGKGAKRKRSLARNVQYRRSVLESPNEGSRKKRRRKARNIPRKNGKEEKGSEKVKFPPISHAVYHLQAIHNAIRSWVATGIRDEIKKNGGKRG